MNIDLKNESYEIIIKKDVLNSIYDYLPYFNKILIVTDDNIPTSFIEQIKKDNVGVFIFEHGEKNKSYKTYLSIQNYLIKHNFTRKDLIIALGGGVTTDLVGFVASTFKRGIKYISIPTSTLSQIDSSIGGKCAINYKGYKNILGAFYHPYKVFIDVNTIKTLPRRDYINGLMEALKMALLFDKQLYNVFLKNDIDNNIEYIINRTLYLKKLIVEQDEKEQNIRKVLNFGHTIGHALECFYKKENLLHGEAIAMGMLFFIEDNKLKEEVKSIIRKFNIEIKKDYNINSLIRYIKNDKKNIDEFISIVSLNKLEDYSFKTLTIKEIKELLKRGV